MYIICPLCNEKVFISIDCKNGTAFHNHVDSWYSLYINDNAVVESLLFEFKNEKELMITRSYDSYRDKFEGKIYYEDNIQTFDDVENYKNYLALT